MKHCLTLILLGLTSIYASSYKEGLKLYQNEEYKKAYTIFKDLEEKNDIDSMLLLGRMYIEGKGVPKNEDTGEKVYKKAFGIAFDNAKNGNARAEAHLGYMYANGYGVQKNNKKAIYWYQKSADEGDSYGQLRLGHVYSSGRLGTLKSLKKAIYWYEKSALQNNVRAQESLADLYSDKSTDYISGGSSKRDDSLKSIDWYKKAYENGSDTAPFYLGRMYCYGMNKGIQKDLKKCSYWIKIAHEEDLVKDLAKEMWDEYKLWKYE